LRFLSAGAVLVPLNAMERSAGAGAGSVPVVPVPFQYREFSHRRVDIYPAILNRTEHMLGIKVDTKCEMKESYPEAKYTSFTEEEEAAIDIISAKYERYGNGVEAPEKLEIIKEKCNELGSTNSTGRLFWDIITGLKWAGYLKPKIREVMLESPTIQFYDKVNLFCKLPEDKMLKYTPIINAKLTDTKKLRDRFLGYLEDAMKQSRINMGEIVCIGRDFWAKVIDMHDDIDGFREFSHRRVDIYPAILNRTEHMLGIKVDTKCEMKESYPEAKYTSFTVLIVKLLTKYFESAL
ncbi:unnamed protein product, partial [Medioppia subpectinata]